MVLSNYIDNHLKEKKIKLQGKFPAHIVINSVTILTYDGICDKNISPHWNLFIKQI